MQRKADVCLTLHCVCMVWVIRNFLLVILQTGRRVPIWSKGQPLRGMRKYGKDSDEG